MSEEVYDPLDRDALEKQQREQADRHKAQKARAESIFRDVFGGDDKSTKEVIAYLKEFCFFEESNYRDGASAEQTIFREGRRSVILQILAMGGHIENKWSDT